MHLLLVTVIFCASTKFAWQYFFGPCKGKLHWKPLATDGTGKSILSFGRIVLELHLGRRPLEVPGIWVLRFPLFFDLGPHFFHSLRSSSRLYMVATIIVLTYFLAAGGFQ